MSYAVQRVAKAWLDMASGADNEWCHKAFGRALFHEPSLLTTPEGMVLVRDITFATLNEHNLLPYHGRCHVAYIPCHGVILGLSKLARAARYLSMRIQTLEKLSQDLMEAVRREVGAAGVAVVVQACLVGAEPRVSMQSISTSGCFTSEDSSVLEEMRLLLGLDAAVDGEKSGAKALAAADETTRSSLPRRNSTSRMVSAVEILLKGVGENPYRQGLQGSALRYVQWLQSATSGYTMSLPVPAVADLGPSTPDIVVSDVTDTSSDDLERESWSSACRVDLRAERRPFIASQNLEVLSVPFTSQCEHHLLPFYGNMKVAFSGRCSRTDFEARLQKAVLMYSQRLQVQERLTQQVADCVVGVLGGGSLLLLCESMHMCMVARGVEEHASATVTTAVRGAWATTPAARRQAFGALLETLEMQSSTKLRIL